MVEIWDLNAARRDKLIKALWPETADRPEYAEYMTLDELISAVCARLEANRYYLERKTI
mgnify:CR=1 FL=1